MIPLERRETAADKFGRLFDYAVSAKINLGVIDEVVSKSLLVHDLDRGITRSVEFKSTAELFEELFPFAQTMPSVQLRYNDAYWCGWAYMQLFFETQKPIPYLILTMPLSLMLSLYPVYHEMDITQLIDRFDQEAHASTIMNRLIKQSYLSARMLSEISGVSPNTIKLYRKADENLYRASFQNAYRLAAVLGVNPDVFLRETL